MMAAHSCMVNYVKVWALPCEWCIHAGDIHVAAEYSATGTVAKGSMDYVLMYYWFCIVVVEGKLHDQLLKHSGQLAAEMRSAREQFRRTMLRKRKHEPEGDFSQVRCRVSQSCQATVLLRMDVCFADNVYVASHVCRCLP